MKTPLQTVREKVIEAVPDLVSKYADSLWANVRNGAGKDAYSEVEDYINENPEIVPIRLSDVLSAVDTKAHKDLSSKPIRIPLPRLGIFGKVSGKWDLTKDDLSLQSEETITFLADLLKTN